MAKITKEVRNSKETIFGGAGSVIPRPKVTKSSTKNSASEAQNSALPQEMLDQIFQEAREQWGYQPESDESEPSNSESWNEPIELYYAGDSIGAMAEGSSGGTVPFEKAITGLQAFPNGTDESDTARLFLRHCSEVGVDDFDVLDWYAYHTRHRAATSYGKTWHDHFSTVEYILKKNGQLDYQHLLQLSKDRGSNGNGCLAQAYPIATLFGDRAQAVAEQVTAATHMMALPTMAIAVAFFQGEKTLDEVVDESFPQHRNDLWDLTPLSHACLCAAAIIAREETIEGVIRLALAKGGDVDSYLSLGLLMWGKVNDLAATP